MSDWLLLFDVKIAARKAAMSPAAMLNVAGASRSSRWVRRRTERNGLWVLGMIASSQKRDPRRRDGRRLRGRATPPRGLSAAGGFFNYSCAHGGMSKPETGSE